MFHTGGALAWITLYITSPSHETIILCFPNRPASRVPYSPATKKVMQHSRPDTMTSQDYTPSPPFPPPEHRSPSAPTNPPPFYSSSPPTLAGPIPFPSPPPAPLPTRGIPSPSPSPHRPTPTPTLWSPPTVVPSSHSFPPGSTARNAELRRYAGPITTPA